MNRPGERHPDWGRGGVTFPDPLLIPTSPLSSRRRFLATAAAGAGVLPFAASALGQSIPSDVAGDGRSSVTVGPRRPITAGPVKPARLRQGDTVGIVSPAGATFAESALAATEREIRRLGFQAKRGEHALDQYGYLGGTDINRAADVMTMFRDPEVKAILALRGGWGCARLLPYLDYEIIRQNPKIVCGFSDITGLLNPLYAKTGLVSFHGPVASSTWNDFTTSHFRRTVEWGEQVLMQPAYGTAVETLVPGVARGRLVGGNLSVFAALVGSGYFPDTTGHLLFLEEVSEEPYRIDRMMTQLKLAGVLDRIRGVVFGNCRNCDASGGDVSLSLRNVLMDHLAAYRIPVFYGTMIGHITDKFTVPIGVEAEMDASSGTIRLLESAVA